MYSELIICLLVLSHVLSDFYLQNEQIAIGKEKSFKILLKHVLHFFACAFVLTIPFLSWRMLLYIMSLSVLHLLFDYIKIRLLKKNCRFSTLFYFNIDQVLHISAILFLYPYITVISLHTWSSDVISYLSASYPVINNLQYNSLIYCILAFAFLLFLANGGTILTKLFLELPSYLANKSADAKSNLRINPKHSGAEEAAASKQENASEEKVQAGQNDEAGKETYKYGEVIGILERITIFLLIISGHYEGITLVIAAKSIARFKQFDQHNFSDYYLVGTLASTLTAIICGELFLFICNKMLF